MSIEDEQNNDDTGSQNGGSQHTSQHNSSQPEYGPYTPGGKDMIEMGRFLEEHDDDYFAWDDADWETDPKWLDPVNAADLDRTKHKVFNHANKEFLAPPAPMTQKRKLGASGSTVVYQVIYKSSPYKRSMALKVIRCSDGSNPLGPTSQARANALREVHNMRGVRHPHIVVYVASFEDYCVETKRQVRMRGGRPQYFTRPVISDHILCIAMYPPASNNLRTWLENIFRDSDAAWNAWKLARTHTFFGCLAQAVTYLHGSHVKIRHKDIKPENVVIDDWGVPVLTDFGISVHFEGQGVSSGHTAKTVKYAPPEANHEGRRERRSDVFSLGCVYLEMATVLLGNHPSYAEKCLAMTSATTTEDAFDDHKPPDFKYSDALAGLPAYLARLAHDADMLRAREPGRGRSIDAALAALPHVARTMSADPQARPRAGELYPLFVGLCDVGEVVGGAVASRCWYCETERANYESEPSQGSPDMPEDEVLSDAASTPVIEPSTPTQRYTTNGAAIGGGHVLEDASRNDQSAADVKSTFTSGVSKPANNSKASNPTAEDVISAEVELLNLDPTTDMNRVAQTMNSANPQPYTIRVPRIMDERLDQLPEDVQQDLHLFMDNSETHSWTCTPSQNSHTVEIPLKINGFPVVIPVHYDSPLTPILSPPPDPHPRIISPTNQVSDEAIEEIFALFSEAIGFYILINGYLQIIVHDEFDYERDARKYPDHFGGLKVSFIPKLLYPTTGRSRGESQTLAADVNQSDFNRMADPTLSGGASSAPRLEEPATATHPVEDTVLIGSSLTRSFKISNGSSFRAIVKDSNTKERFEGKFGVVVSPSPESALLDPLRRYVTVPTHVCTTAVDASMITTLPSRNWHQSVKIVFANESKELGPLDKIFDPSPGAFPIGFAHDISLVDVTHIPLARTSRTSNEPSKITWMDPQEWTTIKYNSSNLVLLDDDLREAKTIGILDSRCQMVGQGIFLIRQQARRRSFLSALYSSSADPRDDPSIWTSLVARSILYRVRDDSNLRGGQSGTPVCLLSDDNSIPGQKKARVAGFASFVQKVADVQRYEIEGDKLYKRLQEGRVAFYGAFQLPTQLRDEFRII